jgi:hypothetical protein
MTYLAFKITFDKEHLPLLPIQLTELFIAPKYLPAKLAFEQRR